MQRYRLVFSGELAKGVDQAQAAEQLGALLGVTDTQRLGPLFSGRPVTLRRDLPATAATAHYLALRKAGLILRLERSDPCALPAPKPLPGGAPEPLATPPVADPPTPLAMPAGTSEPVRPEPPPARPQRKVPARAGARRERAGAVPLADPPTMAIAAVPVAEPPLSPAILWAAGAALCVAAGLLVLRALLITPPPGPPAITAVAVDDSQRLFVLAGDRLIILDRAGVEQRTLSLPDADLPALEAPLLALGNDQLLASARSATGWGLWRCDLATPACLPFAPILVFAAPPNIAHGTADGAVYVADRSSGTLFKVDANGQLLASKSHRVADDAGMVLRDGLLYAAHPLLAAVDVLLPDTLRFGNQVDRLLLPAVADHPNLQLRSLLPIPEGWWLLVDDASDGGQQLLRTDLLLTQTGSMPLANQQPRQLLRWGERVLLRDDITPGLDRYSVAGEPGAPLYPASLRSSAAQSQAAYRSERRQLWLAVTLLGLAGIGLLARDLLRRTLATAALTLRLARR